MFNERPSIPSDFPALATVLARKFDSTSIPIARSSPADERAWTTGHREQGTKPGRAVGNRTLAQNSPGIQGAQGPLIRWSAEKVVAH
jgi:hypothetical protein